MYYLTFSDLFSRILPRFEYNYRFIRINRLLESLDIVYEHLGAPMRQDNDGFQAVLAYSRGLRETARGNWTGAATALRKGIPTMHPDHDAENAANTKGGLWIPTPVADILEEQKTKRKTIFTLIVSISTYADGTTCDRANASAGVFRQFLNDTKENSSFRFKINQVNDQEATFDKLLESLQLFEKATADDICLIYFSGLGANNESGDAVFKRFFYEADAKMYVQNTKVYVRLMTLLGIWAGNFPQFIFIREGDGMPDFRTNETFQQVISSGLIDLVSLEACAPNEYAKGLVYPSGKKVGIFTHYLVEILRGVGNPIPRWREIVRQLEIKMSSQTDNQHPVFSAGKNPDSPIFSGAFQKTTTSETVTAPKLKIYVIKPTTVVLDWEKRKDDLFKAYAESGSLFFDLIDYEKTQPTVPPDYIISIKQYDYALLTNVSDEPLFVPSSGVNMFLNDVDTVSNWHFSRDMNNYQSDISDKDFDVKLEIGNQSTGNWQTIDWSERVKLNVETDKIRFTLTNQSERDLYVGGFWLDRLFAVSTDLFPVRKCPPTHTLQYPNDSKFEKGLRVFIDSQLLQLGKRDIAEYIKIVVSTQPIDLSSLDQHGVKILSERGFEREEFTRSTLQTNDWQAQRFWKTKTINLRLLASK